MSTRIINARMAVWKPDWVSASELHEADGAKEIDSLAASLTFARADDDRFTEYGMSLVGTADVSIVIGDRGAIVAAEIAALRSRRDKVRAEAEAKAMKIEERIQSLLAITHEVKHEG